jgi:hypothetical protein
MFAQSGNADGYAEAVACAPEPVPARRAKGRGKYNGRAQMNFGVDPDVQFAIRFARVMRGKDNSEICNEALRAYLAPEIEHLSKEGWFDGINL